MYHTRDYGPYEAVKSQYRKKRRVRLIGKRGTHPYLEARLIDALIIVERVRPYDKT